MTPISWSCKVWTPEDRDAQDDLTHYCITNMLNLGIQDLPDGRKGFTVWPPVTGGNIQSFHKLKNHINDQYRSKNNG